MEPPRREEQTATTTSRRSKRRRRRRRTDMGSSIPWPSTSTSSWILLASGSLFLLQSLLGGGGGLAAEAVTLKDEDDGSFKCYVCNPDRDFQCSPQDLWGNLTRCADGVKTCYKSWTVEADPKTQRRCGHRNDRPDEEGRCKEALKKNNKAIVCKCGTSKCNGVTATTATASLLVLGVSAALFLTPAVSPKKPLS